jgi:hypothetical protein
MPPKRQSDQRLTKVAILVRFDCIAAAKNAPTIILLPMIGAKAKLKCDCNKTPTVKLALAITKKRLLVIARP